jgi:muramoyltetrapeptide carboxypeptidase LdcA involved in peptidoglycan recycling
MKIGVIAPSFRGPIKEIIKGVRILESQGHTVVLGREVLSSPPRFTSPFERVNERIEEILTALRDDSLDCIWCADGGAGAYRLLPEVGMFINSRDNALKPIPLIGFSDITFLHMLLLKYNRPCFIAPNLCCEEPWHEKQLAECCKYVDYMSKNPNEDLVWEQDVDQLMAGEAHGILLGGTFSCMMQTLGTEYCPDFDGSIVLTEEHGPTTPGQHEYLFWFNTQRMWLSDAWRRVNGFVFGEIDVNGPYENSEHVFPSIWEIIAKSLPGANCVQPICAGLDHGYSGISRPIPLGVESSLRVKDSNVELICHGSFPKRFL